MATIAIVTRDVTPFNLAHPVAEILSTSEHDVRICAAGASAKKWDEAGYSFSKPIVDDVSYVLTGASTKPELESSMLQEAAKNGIPCGVLVDMPGAQRRFEDPLPETVTYFVADSETEVSVQSDHPDARIHIVGNSNVMDIEIPKEAQAVFAKLREKYEEIVLFAGRNTTSDLHVIAESIAMYMPKACLLTGFHPDPAKRPVSEMIREALAVLDSDRVQDAPYNSAICAALSDYTTLSYTGLAYTAAWNGSKVVSVRTPQITEEFQKDCPGGIEFPMVTAKVAQEITGPCDFRKLPFISQNEVTHRVQPYNAHKVVDHILSTMDWNEID